MTEPSLQDTKVGDTVILRSGGWNSSAVIVRVNATTATQIIVSGVRYRRKNGRRVGESFGGSWIDPATDENIKEARALIEESKTRRRINVARNALREFDVTAENINAVESFLASQSP